MRTYRRQPRWLVLVLALSTALALSACGRGAQEANPALWRIDGPDGQRGWLFGTIHSLPRPVRWRTPAIGDALDQADSIVVEVGDLTDDAALAQAFSDLSQSPGLPPLDQRVAPELRKPLSDLLARGRMDADRLGQIETWAIALTLARIPEGALDATHGVDRAVTAAARGRPIVELEGIRGQLAIFDGLPEAEQRDLLAMVVRDARNLDTETAGLAEAWRTGRMDIIEGETRRGLLADPELRQALYTARNRAWAARIAAMLTAGHRPFVAVGAAHMAGTEGLPLLLQARGLRVTRIQ